MTLTAVSEDGWVLVGWEGDVSGTANPADVTMDSDKAVTAVFARLWSLTREVVGEGKVDPWEGTYWYVDGTTVWTEATASAGWEFDHWEGAATGPVNPVPVLMNGDQTLTAVFVEQPGPPGDVDGDGIVNAVDIQLVINASLGQDIGGLDADINGDGVVNAVDIQLVINAALGD